MDPSEYKHVVLGLIFLKYISDAFEELHAKLAATLAKLGQASAAQRWAQRALELAPDDLAVRASLPGNLR